MTHTLLTKTALVASLAALTVSGLASVALAQSAAPRGTYDQNGYYYDPCQRSTVNRTTGGGLLGAALGAAMGASIAGKNNKTEGAVLGGLLGAAVGTSAGKKSAACDTASGATSSRTYGSGYGYGDDSSVTIYESRTIYPKAGNRDFDRRHDWDWDDAYAYNRPIKHRPPVDRCTLAESPIYMPDGRVQKRFVKVCPDANGIYQVVD